MKMKNENLMFRAILLKKINLFLFVIAALFSSCSKTETETKAPAASNLNLVKKIETKIAPNTTISSISFTYEGNKLIKSVDAKAETTYNYTGDLLTYIRILYTLTSTQKTITFNYENNKLINYTSVAPFVSEKKVYFYNSNGIVSSTYTITPRTGDVVTKYELITLSNGNPVKVETTQNNLSEPDLQGVIQNNVTAQNIITYEYDDKKNPAKNILGFNKLLIARDILPLFNSENNVLSINEVKKYSVAGNVFKELSYFPLTYSYKYNPEGFPTSKEEYTDTRPMSTYSY